MTPRPAWIARAVGVRGRFLLPRDAASVILDPGGLASVSRSMIGPAGVVGESTGRRAPRLHARSPERRVPFTLLYEARKPG